MSFMYDHIAVLILLCGIALLLYFTGRMGNQRKGRGLKPLLIMILSLLVVQIVFRNQGHPIWHWKFLCITREGLHYGVSASLRLLIIFFSAGFLLRISYYEYLLSFQSWKIPYELSFLIASVIQFLPVLRKELQNMEEALVIRGIKLSELGLWRRLEAYRELVLPILGKAIASLKYRVISLEMRAFRLYSTRTALHEDRLKIGDYIIQAGLVALILVSIIK